jgi:electron transfer flavoprotein beta subunit
MGLKIMVCIRAVPTAGSAFRINRAGTGYDEAGLSFQVNEYDLFAMEEAVRLKERAGAEVTAVTVGPARAQEQLRKAMGLGADRGCLIDDAAAPAPDALATASLLAAWARPRGFDLILCGVMSEDLQRGQTGPMLAELLGMAGATTVIKLDLDPGKGRLTCERELEGCRRERVELSMPALITVQSGINLPRYASLSNVLRVKRLEVPIVPAATLGPTLSGQRTVRAYLPEATTTCEFLAGDPRAVARALILKIRARAPVI